MKHQARKLDSAQFERAAALSRVSDLTSELARLVESRVQCAASPRPQSRVSARNLQESTLRGDWYRSQEAQTQQALKKASMILQDKERHLRIARRELKKFELLKERRYSDWQKQALASEQKQLDEVASRRGRRPAQFASGSGKVGLAGFDRAL